jgi:peptidoglycan hydrolase-like protein with peptidoglycan-binding domain
MQAMPLIFNDPGITPVQLNMHGSVGFGGNNVLNDVKTIQMMLNALPQNVLGLSKPLVVDGVAGRLTIDAIQRYQRAAKLKVVDGRIDPCGATVRALGSQLIGLSVFPNALPVVSVPDSKFLQFFDPAYPPIPRPQTFGVQAVADSGARTHALGDSTGWRVVSTFKSSAGFSWGSVINFQSTLERRSDKKKLLLQFTGAGVGVSLKPLRYELQLDKNTLFATDMCFGAAALLAKSVPVPTDEFAPKLASLAVFSVGVPGAGVGVNLLTIGGTGGAVGEYQCFSEARQIASFGAGFTGYVGATTLSNISA